MSLSEDFAVWLHVLPGSMARPGACAWLLPVRWMGPAMLFGCPVQGTGAECPASAAGLSASACGCRTICTAAGEPVMCWR